MYKLALKINPNDGEAYTNQGDNSIKNLGIALIKLGKFNDVIILFDRALEINPKDGVAFKNKGVN